MEQVQPLISVNNLNKTFMTKAGPVNVLKNITATVMDNTFTVIFGPSGSGKTTLLNVLSGLEAPTSGKVLIDNSDVYSLDSDSRAYFRAQNLGLVYQANYWIKSLDVLENVALPLYLIGMDKSKAIEMAEESLRKIDLLSFAHYQPVVLSLGQQRRISMARALVASPKIIYADEPTGNLDSVNSAMIMDLLLACKRELNRTVVLVTHNIEHLRLSDVQFFISDGVLTQTVRGQKLPESVSSSLREEVSELTALENQ